MSQPTPNPSPDPRTKYQFSSERLSTASEGLRLWAGKAWKIGVMMAKGAYLLGERRRLLLKLGEDAFSRLKSGEWKGDDLEQLVRQLERVTKKIDIEEKLIQSARFGASESAPRNRSEDAHNEDEKPEKKKTEKESKAEKGKSK